jgi:hypothetical protein
MQIDFHHAVTYVATRLAGMSDAQARVVAHSAQYVDDATLDGPLVFDSGERYVRVTSAHKTLNFSNLDTADNRMVWVPFHFLPGNESPPAGSKPDEAFLRRMMCKPDSAVARAMVRDCITNKNLTFGLHRFGIALHTYIDTWAHQQFVGAVCDLNRVKQLKPVSDPGYKDSEAFKSIVGSKTGIMSYLASHAPVGHAGALTFPDIPFLKWLFVRENGERVERDNPTDFMAAAAGMYNMARRFKAGDFDLPAEKLPEPDRSRIESLVRTTLFIDPEPRHRVWLDAIKAGQFSFGSVDLAYVEKGPGSWKFDALGLDPDEEEGVTYKFKPTFLESNWKRFHDAVQYHRLYVLHDLLPQFGLCAS